MREGVAMMLPADAHVHSEYSWDTGGPASATAVSTMQRTCVRSVHIGLPAVIFTEHLDFSAWAAAPEDFLEHLRPLIHTCPHELARDAQACVECGGAGETH